MGGDSPKGGRNISCDLKLRDNGIAILLSRNNNIFRTGCRCILCRQKVNRNSKKIKADGIMCKKVRIIETEGQLKNVNGYMRLFLV